MNPSRYTMTTDARRNKGAANLSRTGRSATVKRSAKSPSPPALESDQHEGTQQDANGLVISNRNNFMEEEEELGDGEMEGLKKEEDDTLSLLIDSRLLHKDFIVDKFSMALVYFRKVSAAPLSFPALDAPPRQTLH